MAHIKPSVLLAYILVVMIWSTTPITIQWSSQGVDFLFGITARMTIGTVLAVMLCLWRYKKLPLHATALYVYSVSAMSVFGAMLIVYWGAQFIPSGLVSVLFGFTPVITAFMAALLLQNERLTGVKITGGLIGIAGLLIIFMDQLHTGHAAFLGVAAVLVSVFLHALSAVLVKRAHHQLPALNITAGSLLLSLPLFWITYALFAPPLPEFIPHKALLSIIYLGVMGSLVGFVSFYYVLQHMTAGSVSLITLLTPVLALWIGYAFNHEVLDMMFAWGTVLVLLGLIWHQWGRRLLKKILI